MKKFKLLSIVSFSINIIFIILVTLLILKRGGVTYIKSMIKPDTQVEFSNYHLIEKSVFEILPKEDSEIIFVGDSLTDYCNWGELFSDNKIKNMGIQGDTITGLLDNLDIIIKNNPQKVFIMIGINDLKNGTEFSSIVENYGKMIDRIERELPNTKVILQSILPINEDILSTKVTNNDIVKLNNEIKEMAEKNNLQYVDLNSKFIDSKEQLEKELTVDGIHINGQGYLIWKQEIEKYVYK